MTTETDSRVSLLAQAAFFPRRYRHGDLLFAEMPAADGVPHGVALDPAHQRLYCTCSFWPKPCRHARALQLLHARVGDALFDPLENLPAWAGALLEGRPAGARAVKPPAAEAAPRRRTERLERAARGLDDLEAWLTDTLRRGLAAVVSEEPHALANMAARLADASLGGLSRLLRRLDARLAEGAGWEEPVLNGLADCALALRAFRRRDDLPEAMLYDLDQFLGLSIKKDVVLAEGERMSDAWAVLGQVEETLESTLRARRTWLLGGRTGRYALLLDYAPGQEPFPPGLIPGAIYQGSLAYYPSAWPLRALPADEWRRLDREVRDIGVGYDGFQDMFGALAHALGRQPWLDVFPAAFRAATPYRMGTGFFLADAAGYVIPLAVSEAKGWQVLAWSGGHAVGGFGEWVDGGFRLLGVVADRWFWALEP